ncbi:hypothetical protein [Synechococcus sp. MIT S9509]|uniref:hypothetical protein n=1 Tax=Synechococcus sp. MIT S9509 TaxID=1801630 RepID=UPI0008313A41|nr:hypothetical protein [Synechococcus sp. MIT S9509]
MGEEQGMKKTSLRESKADVFAELQRQLEKSITCEPAYDTPLTARTSVRSLKWWMDCTDEEFVRMGGEFDKDEGYRLEPNFPEPKETKEDAVFWDGSLNRDGIPVFCEWERRDKFLDGFTL